MMKYRGQSVLPMFIWRQWRGNALGKEVFVHVIA